MDTRKNSQEDQVNNDIEQVIVSDASLLHPQTQMAQAKHLQSNQFVAAPLHFQPHFGLNQMSALFAPPDTQSYGSGYSFQSLLNSPIPPFENQTINISKRSKKRGKKTSQTTQSSNPRRFWTIAEDIALTKAYLYVTIDSIIGKDQSQETMWNRIMKAWKENMGENADTRHTNGLSCRWGLIQAAVNKFHALYESLERAPRSGTSILDLKREAMKMYKEIEDSPFKYEHCWEIMKENPKWCSQLLTKSCSSLKKEKTVDDSLVDTPHPLTTTTPLSSHTNGSSDVDNPEAENTDVDGVVRPLGRKNSKEKKRRTLEQKGVIDILTSFQSTFEKQYMFNQQELELKKEKEKKDYELMEQMMKRDLEFKEKAQKLKEEAQRQKEKSKKREEQECIMNLDLAKLQHALQKAYEKMQAKILKEWEKEGLLGDDIANKDMQI